MKNKKNNNNNNYKELYGDFTCPGCGRSTSNGDNIYDAGNGFCQDCAADH
ncbi:TPA: hypothetical protein K8M70_000849 [Clostridium perfringens]|nr:hypothetical protein [Clostridium perfringens]HBI7027404.1 hypothetical protein [Clostridium perfringens]HBI7035302.1 hypothetical protein [Clostridium perfringens]HBI7049539.1 hypothetical protein [Clostridium perfringens]